ncbi:MAG: hypothetical protein HGA97_09330 [Chlorobiaceae bacterium]|nr:hypothetical protein [Chlorobiaceae bacterium]
MMFLLILLAVNVVLLLLIIIMLATGWPLRLRDEIERTAQSLRRELAEQRSDSLQLMKSLRIVVEDAVKESVEKEMASRPRSGRPRKATSSKAQEAGVAQENSVEEESGSASQPTILQTLQIPLFPEKAATDTVAVASRLVPAEPQTEKAPEAETIHMGYVDDIPDVE